MSAIHLFADQKVKSEEILQEGMMELFQTFLELPYRDATTNTSVYVTIEK